MTTTAAPTADIAGVDALTADSGIVHIRPVRPTEDAALAALYDRASMDNLRMRFFGSPGHSVIRAEVERLCRPSIARHGA